MDRECPLTRFHARLNASHWPTHDYAKILSMPTVLRIGPYRIYFYSHEPHEPPHVHIDRDNFSAKFWLEPVGLARNLGFNAR